MYPATNIRDRNSWNIQSAKAFLYLNKKLIYNTPIRLFSEKLVSMLFSFKSHFLQQWSYCQWSNFSHQKLSAPTMVKSSCPANFY